MADLKVGIGADLDPLKKELNEAGKKISGFSSDTKSSLEDVSKSFEKTDAVVKDTFRTYDQLEGIIQEQKEITIEFEKELRNLEDQLKATGKAAFNLKRDALTKQVSNLKDAIKDQRISLKALNLEKQKSKKVDTSVIGNLKKSSELTQLLDRKTGGLASAFIDLGSAAKLSGKAMKSALIVSGIGILAIAVAEIVENWEAISGWIDGSTEKLKQQKSVIDQINKASKESQRIQSLAHEGISQATESRILEAQIAGKSKADIFKIEKEGLEAISKLRLQESNQALKNFRLARDNEAKDLEKFRDEMLDAQQAFENSKGDIATAGLKEQLRLQIEGDKNQRKSFVTQKNWVIDALKDTQNKITPITQNISKLITDSFTIPTTTVTDAQLRLAEMKLLLEQFNDEASNLISGNIAETFAGLGTAIGSALATGGSILESAGKALLGGLGGILIDMGKMAISMGVKLLAIKIGLKSLNPGLLIAAGAALVALGSFFSSKASAAADTIGGGNVSSSGGGSSSFSGTTTSQTGSGGFDGSTVVFEIEGVKLVGVLSNTLSRNRALGGSLGLG